MTLSNSKRGTVLVLGATSGIGKAIARQWAMAGYSIILAGRDMEEMERNAADLRVRHNAGVVTIAFDALALDTFASFWNECQARASGAIAGVVLCYGYMTAQADAQQDALRARQTIDTNYTSPVLLLERIASDFEKRRRGFICAVSSVAGDRGRQSNYIYGSSKAALSTYLAGLRIRLFKAGVTVVTLKPGFVDTAMTWGLPGMFLVASPEQVAADTIQAVRWRSGTSYSPWFWRYIMLIIRSIPDFMFKRMKM